MLALQGKSGARVPSGQGWDVKGWPQGAAALENHLLCFPLKHLRIAPSHLWPQLGLLPMPSLSSAWDPVEFIRPVVAWATSDEGHMGQEDSALYFF